MFPEMFPKCSQHVPKDVHSDVNKMFPYERGTHIQNKEKCVSNKLMSCMFHTANNVPTKFLNQIVGSENNFSILSLLGSTSTVLCMHFCLSSLVYTVHTHTNRAQISQNPNRITTTYSQILKFLSLLKAKY